LLSPCLARVVTSKTQGGIPLKQYMVNPVNEKEKALLVSLASPELDKIKIENRYSELRLLCKTAGVTVVSGFIQKRSSPHPSYFIGRGKLEEIKEEAENREIDVVIFNEELSPVQTRNLENYLETKVLDRTALILDIFAKRARTKEGKLQVEMAQLQYLLTRLTGHGSELSRLGGGIGTRGPGETKLEIDRRRIRRRISELNRSLEEVKKHRSQQRKQRKKAGYHTAGLVGYTNAGKSTLLNALSGAQAFTENKLFATLDPTVRKITLDNGEEILISDTVGFIQEMPSQLMKAFKATLEEINEAGLILHLIDISNPEFIPHMETVEEILNDIITENQDILLIFNKIDRINPGDINLDRLKRDYPNSTFISASEGTGIEELKQKISLAFKTDKEKASFKVPYDQMGFLDQLYKNARILNVKYKKEHLAIDAEAPSKFLEKNRRYLATDTNIAGED